MRDQKTTKTPEEATTTSPVQADLVFDDPVGYLADHGIEADLLELETALPSAA